MRPPNLLLFIADQFRYDSAGFAGGEARTPNLDALASESTVFRRCYTTSPQCVSARISFARCRYPHETRVWNNVMIDMAATVPTWMRALRDAGYRTSIFGKSHLHRHLGDLRDNEPQMREYGWDDVDEVAGPWANARVASALTDEWKRLGWFDALCDDYRERDLGQRWVPRPSPLPVELQPDVYIGRRAAEYLERYDDPRPWCCTVGFAGPHDPFDAPEPWASLHAPADMPRPRDAPTERWPRARGHYDDLTDEAREEGIPSPSDIAALRANYAGKIALIDREVGRVLDVVRSRDALESTLIVFTSDHGGMNGDADLLYKSVFLDGAVRVPLVVRPPGPSSTGRACDAPVEWFDAASTLLDYGTGSPAFGRAKSLRPMLNDPDAATRTDVMSGFLREIMLADRHWKIVLNKDGIPYMLFDVANDPGESSNVVGDPANASTLRALSKTIFARVRGD